jgi:hypothetical protein
MNFLYRIAEYNCALHLQHVTLYNWMQLEKGEFTMNKLVLLFFCFCSPGPVQTIMTVSISFPSHVPPATTIPLEHFLRPQVVTRSFISRFWLTSVTWQQQQLRFFFSYYNWIYNLTSLFYSHWQNVWLTGPDNVCSFPSRKREKREKTEKNEFSFF